MSPIEYVTGFTQRVFSFPKSLLYSTKVVLFSQKKDTLAALKTENKRLEEKLADYDQLKKDNEAFKSQFAESGSTSDRILAAQVIGFVGKASMPTQLVIDKGSRNGVKQNMTVVEGRQFVGKIGNVSPAYSVVYLPVNSEFTTLGKTSSTNAEGIVKGEGDFILYDNVLITDKLQKGDLVITKGEVQTNGIGVMPNYIVGKVISVARVESRPFQNAELQSFLDYSKLSQVFVVVR